MPTALNLYINAFWLCLLIGVIGALIRLHYKVRREIKQHRTAIVKLEQQQAHQVARIETIEQAHQTILQELAHVFDRLKTV